MGARDIETIYRLAPLQEGMLFHSLDDPELGMYVEQATCTLEGELDPARLRRAWERVVGHHPALRASFHWREVERAVQVIHREVEVPWREEDRRADDLDSEAEAARFRALLEADRRRGFDLERPPLLRLTLVRTGARRWRFLWTYHHLLLDGWSLLPVLEQVFDVYAALGDGREPSLPPARPYEAYISWLEGRDTPGARAREEAFWRRALEGFRAATPLPGARGAGRPSSRPATESRVRRLPREPTAAVAALARRAGVTPGTVVQAAWALVLGRSAGEDDVLFGSVVSGRPGHLAGATSMVGLFINTLPVRVRVDEGAPTVSWLRRIQEDLVALREHEHSPLPRIRRWTDVPPGVQLFESLVAFENYPRDPGIWRRVGGVAVRDLESHERTNYPLNLAAVPGDELYLELTFDPERFEPGAPERILRQVETLLAGMAGEPEGPVAALSLLAPDEERRVLVEWSGAGEARPAAAGAAGAATLHGLVAERVARAPDAVAVAPCGRAEAWTYGALAAAAAAVEDRVRAALAAGEPDASRHPEPRVAVLLERSAEACAAVLGVLRAGGAYLPLDPDLPDRRLLDLLADAGAAVVVTRRDLWLRLADRSPARPVLVEERDEVPHPSPHRPPSSDPDRAAYVVYTSGSTGRPKGVVVTHRSVVHLVRAARDHLPPGPHRSVVHLASPAFDASVAELFFALAAGGTVCPVDRETLLSPPHLARDLARARADVLLATPVLLEALAPDDVPRLPRVLVGADRCPPAVAARWSAGRRFSNHYGPTEATIYCLFHPGPGGAHGPPLGRPIPGARVHVLDRRLRPVPPGVPGEILLAGAPLARGYLDRPATTAERFVPDPFASRHGAGGRLYRSGDLGCFLPDGAVDFLGRIDHQVKIRGQRVECGEVEVALGEHPAVAEVAVVARGEAPHRRLAAFVVPRRGAELPDPDELRSRLARRLPEAMVPAAVEWLDELPRGATGKVDRRVLERRPAAGPAGSSGRCPAAGVEATLARIWSEVLGLAAVAADDDFFRLGGDSILAIRVISRAAEEGIELTPRLLFENPTVARLAAALAEIAPEEGGAGAGDAAGGPVPLTPVQRAFFDLGPAEPHHWNLPALLTAREPLDPGHLGRALAALRRRHDALRLVFELAGDAAAGGPAHRWRQRVAPPGEAATEPFAVVDLSALPEAAFRPALDAAARNAQAGLDLGRGPLLAVLFAAPAGEADRLLLVLHHLAVDAVSWGVLLETLERLYRAEALGTEPRLPPRTLPFARWARELEARAQSPEVEAELPLWRAQVPPAGEPGPALDGPGGVDTEGAAEAVHVEVDAETTGRLLDDALQAYQSRPEELMVTALARVLAREAPAAGPGGAALLLEGHGRPDDVDLSGTVGWLTALYPVRLEVAGGVGAGAMGADLKAVKERLRSIPRRGLGYGLLRHLRPDLPGTDDLLRQPALAFNYLGRLDRAFAGATLLALDPAPLAVTRSPRARRATPVEVNAYVLDGRLRLDWRFGPARIRRETVKRLAEAHRAELRAVVEHCLDPAAGGLTPSDFPASDLDQASLDRLLGRLSDAGGPGGRPAP